MLIEIPQIVFDLRIFFINRIIRLNLLDQIGDLIDERQQDHSRDQTEKAVHIGDATGIQGGVPEAV